MVTLYGCCDITQNIRKKRVIAGKLSFKIVCDGYFYKYFMGRSVVMATVKVDMVTKSRILGRISYCW